MLIFGGSLGAEKINNNVVEIFGKIVDDDNRTAVWNRKQEL